MHPCGGVPVTLNWEDGTLPCLLYTLLATSTASKSGSRLRNYVTDRTVTYMLHKISYYSKGTHPIHHRYSTHQQYQIIHIKLRSFLMCVLLCVILLEDVCKGSCTSVCVLRRVYIDPIGSIGTLTMS